MPILFDSTRVRKTGHVFGFPLTGNEDRLPVGPTPYDEAWATGYYLAIEGIDADPPSDLSPWQAESFLEGVEAGRLDLEAERNAIIDRDRERLDREVGRYGEQEVAEIGSQLGHEADTARFADDFYTALRSEGA